MTSIKLSQFKLKKAESFEDWEGFCVESLETAKATIGEFRNERVAAGNALLQAMLVVIRSIGWDGLDRLVNALIAGGVVSGVALGLIALGLLTNPVALAICVGGGGFLMVASYKLYKHRKLLIEVHRVLIKEKVDFGNLQPGTRHKKEIDTLFKHSIQVVLDQVFNKKIMFEDDTIPLDPVCLCGRALKPKLSSECYGTDYSIVLCDICDEIIADDCELFHCPDGYNNLHSRGFDLCIKCTRKHNDKLKRYHAFIIDDDLQYNEYKKKDEYRFGNQLFKMFKALNYHSVKLLQGKDVKKKSIFEYLQKLSKFDEDDVIVICYRGHGSGEFSKNFSFSLKYDSPIKDEAFFAQLVNHEDSGKKVSNKTRDICLIINACFSGGFKLKSNKKEVEEVKEEEVKPNLNKHEEQVKAKLSEFFQLNNLDKIGDLSKEEFIELALSKKNQETLKQLKPYLNKWKKELQDILHSVVVVSSSGKKEESSQLMLKLVIEALKDKKKEKLTPKDLFSYIKNNTGKEDDWSVALKKLRGTPNISQQTGKFATAFSLKPILKPYN